MNHKKLLILGLGVVLLIGHLWIDRWPTTLYYGDSNGYYLHVVSFFINQDVGDYDKTITSLQEVNPQSSDPREDEFGIRLTEKGRRYIKYTLGVPLMESPFFLLAHTFASFHPKYEANGWSRPYLFIIGLSIIFYVLLAYFLLIKVLENYFSFKAIALSLVALSFASNLFFQSTYMLMSHGFLFFQHALLIYLTYTFYKKPSTLIALAIGANVGLITLTRVPEVISVMIPLFWGVYSFALAKERFYFFIKNYKYLLIATLGFLALFSIQIVYWYYVSGHFIFNPYEGEGFNFLAPKFYRAFFHFKNGWLLYTPIMFFSLLGLYLLPRYKRGLLLPIFLFIFPHIWIHYSYYVWSYFPGFGQRPMVETYALLSIGLTACFAFFLEKKKWKWLPYFLILGFSVLNLFQTWQMKEGLIWSERNNAAYYWETFASTRLSLNSLRAYDTKELQPEEKNIKWERTLLTENFEASNIPDELRSTTHRSEGQFAYYSNYREFVIESQLPLKEFKKGDWLRLETQAFMHKNDIPAHRDFCLELKIELYDAKGKRRKERSLKVSPHLGNPDFNIWTVGQSGVWGTASFYVRLPRTMKPDWTAKVFIFNRGGQYLYLDQLKLDYYQAIH